MTRNVRDAGSVIYQLVIIAFVLSIGCAHRLHTDDAVKACSQGVPFACVLEARGYLADAGPHRDVEHAIKILTSACNMHVVTHERACVELARVYADGNGVPRDSARATLFLRASCADGHGGLDCVLPGDYASHEDPNLALEIFIRLQARSTAILS